MRGGGRWITKKGGGRREKMGLLVWGSYEEKGGEE